MTETENIQKIAIAEPIQLNINIPDIGNIGKDGKDGTNGVDGKDGRDGDSAYKIAVKNGFVGTEKEWLASLKGGGSNESTNTTLGNLIADDISKQNKETFVDLLTRGVRLERLPAGKSSFNTSDGGVIWDVYAEDFPEEPASSYLLLRKAPQYVTVKRATDNKIFLASVKEEYFFNRNPRNFYPVRLEDNSDIRLTTLAVDIRYRDDKGIEHTGNGYAVKSRTEGYTVLDGVTKASAWTQQQLFDSNKKFVCNDRNIGLSFCSLQDRQTFGRIDFTELVITYETQDGTKFNRHVYDFELSDEDAVIALDVPGIKLKFRNFDLSLYLHSVGSINAIITGVYYK